MTKDEIFALPLSKLELPSIPRNDLLNRYVKRKEIAYPSYDASKKRWRDFYLELAPTVTVGMLIELDVGPPKDFVHRLVELGLTRLDWARLPQSTMTLDVMHSISKEEWLKKPALWLGTLMRPSFEAMGFYRDYEKLTVEELLAGPEHTRWLTQLPRRGIENTRALLQQLGFKYEDGWFMQIGSQRKLIAGVMERHSISELEATYVVDIARKEEWIPKFIE